MMTADIYFSITVDTEADDAWRNPDKIGLKNMAAIPRFQSLCESNNIVPVYLLAYECATRDEALSVLTPIAAGGRCEIGYHFHAWTTPPFEVESPMGIDSKWLHAYQYELPDSLFQEKADCLMHAIEDAYHIKPKTHRAGRWGIDQRTVNWLIDNDFEVDSSVVPLLSLSGNYGKFSPGPSFMTTPMDSHIWPQSEDGQKTGRSIVEIPLTVFHPGAGLHKLLARYVQAELPGKQFALRAYHKLIGGKGQLRPDPNYPENELEKIILSQINKQPKIINMMIHSSELWVGSSPFSRTSDSCDRLWRELKNVFEFIKERNIKSLPLCEAAKRIESGLIEYDHLDYTP